MYPSATSLASALVLFHALAVANPLPQYTFAGGNSDGGGACAAAANPPPEYENTSQVKTSGKPIQIGDSCTPSKGESMLPFHPSQKEAICAGSPKNPRSMIHMHKSNIEANAGSPIACTLGREASYSVGVEVSVGMDIELDFAKIASAGINAQVAIQTTDGTTDTNQQSCSGPWACSMVITPSVQEVAGTQHVWVGCPSEKKAFPYTAQFPIKNGDHLPVQHGEPCQCKNFPGFDENNPDAPKPCPYDC